MLRRDKSCRQELLTMGAEKLLRGTPEALWEPLLCRHALGTHEESCCKMQYRPVHYNPATVPNR